MFNWQSRTEVKQPSVNVEAADSFSASTHWLATLKTDGIQVKLPELIYYQSKTSLLTLHPKRRVQTRLAGNYLSDIKGRGMEFDEARHYQPGDDIRTIDWRVTARTGKAHTKLFREERERPVFVFVDLSHSMNFGSQLLFKSVQACHLAALIAWTAKNRGDKVGGLVFNDHQHIELKPKSRQQGVLHLLHALVKTNQRSITNNEHNPLSFEQACARLRRVAHPGALVIVISDFQHVTDNSIKHLSQLSQHCEVKGFAISDPLEQQLPIANSKQWLPIIDGEDTRLLPIGDKKLNQAYQASALAQQEHTETSLRKHGIHLQSLSAGDVLEAQIVSGGLRA